jgi:hypothetical protein
MVMGTSLLQMPLPCLEQMNCPQTFLLGHKIVTVSTEDTCCVAEI